MQFEKAKRVSGEMTLPGDKSISHRAVLFSAIAKGESVIQNLSNAEDVFSSMACVRQLGVEINESAGIYKVMSPGLQDFKEPAGFLDAGNSGTTARLISGMLISQKFATELRGDESLSSRPMKRIIEPLRRFGAKIESAAGETLPLRFAPAGELMPVEYTLPIASAQIKSAVLLAGLSIEGETQVEERFVSRDHTERMLELPVVSKDGVVRITSSQKFLARPKEYHVPGDISTAAFFVVAALLIPGSELLIRNVTLNPTRTGYIDVLRNMGAKIELSNLSTSANEPSGDLYIRSSSLKNVLIEPKLIPNIIDEIPILAVAGAFADGVFEVHGAGELRVKETDRITAIAKNLREAGLEVDEYPDGFSFEPGKFKPFAQFESYGDHRIAMAFSVLSLLLEDGGKINNFECVKISNPDFLNQLRSILR